MNAPLMRDAPFQGSPVPEDALAKLLQIPTRLEDMEALDLLHSCWPRTTRMSQDERLLLIAQNLTTNFGILGRLSMSSNRAWRMLCPFTFAPEFSRQLRDINDFIHNWQQTHSEFLILDFGEIDLVEYLFESLDIGQHAELLSIIMTFKVLSLRRAGLLRRIPARVERRFAPLVEAGRADLAIAELAKVKDFLDPFTDSENYAPIRDAAIKSAARIEKDMEVLRAAADSAIIALE